MPGASMPCSLGNTHSATEKYRLAAGRTRTRRDGRDLFRIVRRASYVSPAVYSENRTVGGSSTKTSSNLSGVSESACLGLGTKFARALMRRSTRSSTSRLEGPISLARSAARARARARLSRPLLLRHRLARVALAERRDRLKEPLGSRGRSVLRALRGRRVRGLRGVRDRLDVVRRALRPGRNDGARFVPERLRRASGRRVFQNIQTSGAPRLVRRHERPRVDQVVFADQRRVQAQRRRRARRAGQPVAHRVHGVGNLQRAELRRRRLRLRGVEVRFRRV